MSSAARYLAMLCVCLSLKLAGCSRHFGVHGAAGQETLLIDATYIENPIFVPAMESEFVWMQLVDTIDDYFQIVREDRVRAVGGVLTEGRIETAPLIGATILEPWRDDSTRGFERWHSTLQSIRRQADVRVMPVADGYTIEVIVQKELEDVSAPEHATVGSSTLRHDGSLVRTSTSPESEPITLGWIALGRDLSLEQEILVELQARLDLHFQ